MHRWISRVASLVLAGVLIEACSPAPGLTQIATSSPLPSPVSSPRIAAPSQVATPEPNPTRTAPARATAWPLDIGDEEPIFGPDGTTYVLTRDAQGEYQRIAMALDPGGHMKPGWPIEAASGSYFASLVAGPKASAYVGECGGPDVGCVLHRLGADGRDLPGWPYEVPDAFACPASDECYLEILDVEPTGVAFLTRDAGDELRVIAIDARGDTVPGWPLVLRDFDWSDLQVGADGTLFAIRRPIGTPTWDPSRGVIDEDAQLSAFGPNGAPSSGWPVPVPNISGYLIGPRGDVVVWSLIDDIGELCSNPRRTVYTVLESDGRTRTGWPRGSKGFASIPAFGDDGTLYYVSATHRLYAHDRTGDVKSGWPVAAPGAGDGCGPVGPDVAADGTIYVVGDEVSALSRDGRALPGWPFRPTASADAPCFDSECFGGPPATAVAPDGTVYVVIHQTDPSGVRAEVVALDRQGRLKPGWPYRVPFNANAVPILTSVAPDGRLMIRAGDQLLALDPDGTISD
jgi:outer membrane protein assembly factor BamB